MRSTKRLSIGTKLSAYVSALAALCFAGQAHAYRPFDGTDADVAEVGEFELELGPANYYRVGRANYLIAPATVLNLGVAPRLEAVVDFKGFVAPRDREQRFRLLDTDVLLKWVLRQGSLQGVQGPSIALEAGPLLPERGGEASLGAQANLIVSERGRLGSLHFNEQAALARNGHIALFSGVILEAPPSYGLRPVGELFAERTWGEGSSYSALLGAIWSTGRAVSVDGAVRVAREERQRALELRFGFTWAERLWPSAPPLHQ